MTTKREFCPPPQELIDRWADESKLKPTLQSACNYIAYRASEWGYNAALNPDPNSLKQQALRGLERIQRIDVVSVWIGKDVFDVIKTALNRLPDNV